MKGSFSNVRNISIKMTSSYWFPPNCKSNILFEMFCNHYNPSHATVLTVNVVYVTIGNPVLCLALYLTCVHFRGELQHVGHVGGKKSRSTNQNSRNRCVRLQDQLYVYTPWKHLNPCPQGHSDTWPTEVVL